MTTTIINTQTTENRGGRAESQQLHHHHQQQQQQQQKRHFYTHLCAGAFAGTMEHTVMFPVDTIKTRMQAAAGGGGLVFLPIVFVHILCVFCLLFPFYLSLD